MIEIYLATLLFGLGTIFHKSQQQQDNSDSGNINNSENPYKQNNMKLVKDAENKLVEKFDTKCRSILPRNFSNLLDPETKEKLADGNNNEILKYVPKNDSTIKSSLTGTDISLDQFIISKTIGKENYNDVSTNTWAIPHFSGTSKQNMDINGYKNKLDIHTGRSEFNFHKKETKNFFKPSKDITFINGAPSVISKLEDRYVQSTKRTNELPFEQIKVASGVGSNYGNKGKGGFHQFEINDLVKPKTIDELRVLSNPQVSYTPPVQTGKQIDKRTAISKLAKHRPDKFYLNTKSRWNKTTGAFTKAKANEKFIQKPTNRTISRQVVGHAAPAQIKNQKKRAAVKESARNNYLTPKPHNPSLAGGWNIKNPRNKEGFQSSVEVEDQYDISSYGKDGIKLPPNERDTTQNKTVITNIVESVKAIISPLQDKMKRTKKQNIEGNPNIKGYIGMAKPSKLTVYDPNDVARTTIRETTENNSHTGSVEGPKKLTVYDPNDVARTTIRETTENNTHEGNVKGATKLIVYDPNDVARTTIKETLIHDSREGNIQLERNKKQMDYNFANAKKTMKETTIDNKHHTNVSYNRGDGKGYLSNEFYAPSTLKQITSDKEYGGNVSSTLNNKGGYLSNKFEAPATLKQFTSDHEYSGVASSSNKSAQSYDSMKNAITNPNKELIAKGRAPTQQGVKVVSGQEEQGNVAVNRQNATINYNNTQNVSVVGSQIVGSSFENRLTKPRVSLSPKNQRELYNPDNLAQLNNNPFALSINRSNQQTETFTDSEDFGSL